MTLYDHRVSYMTLYNYRVTYMTLYDYRDFCMSGNPGGVERRLESGESDQRIVWSTNNLVVWFW